MDNVSSIKFDYVLIRKPNKPSRNLFEYAACLNITHKNNIFLTIDDVCIIDFIHELSSYNLNLMTYEFIPIDAEDKVLIFKRIDSENIEITSEWTDNKIIINQEDLINSIKMLRHSFEKKLKVKIDRYYKK